MEYLIVGIIIVSLGSFVAGVAWWMIKTVIHLERWLKIKKEEWAKE